LAKDRASFLLEFCKDVWLLESVLNLYKATIGKNDISCEEIRDKFLEINTEKEIVQKGENNEIV